MTNWKKYFGSPERAAEMIADSEVRQRINDSVFARFPGIDAEWKHLGSDYRKSYALEWLESEADGVQLG